MEEGRSERKGSCLEVEGEVVGRIWALDLEIRGLWPSDNCGLSWVFKDTEKHL